MIEPQRRKEHKEKIEPPRTERKFVGSIGRCAAVVWLEFLVCAFEYDMALYRQKKYSVFEDGLVKQTGEGRQVSGDVVGMAYMPSVSFVGRYITDAPLHVPTERIQGFGDGVVNRW